MNIDELRQKAKHKANEEGKRQYIVDAPLEGVIVTRWPHGSGDRIIEIIEPEVRTHAYSLPD